MKSLKQIINRYIRSAAIVMALVILGILTPYYGVSIKCIT